VTYQAFVAGEATRQRYWARALRPRAFRSVSPIGFRRLICRSPGHDENRMDVPCSAASFKISRWSRLISYQKGDLSAGFHNLSMTSALAEALP